MLSEAHRQHLARFRIDDEILKAAKVETLSNTAAREALGIHGRAQDDLSGIFFPYFSPATGERVGGRIKLDEKTADNAKYISEQGCRHLFFAPGADAALTDTGIPMIIVEAEKSALALAAWARRMNARLLCVAIGGCWGWKRNNGKELKPSGGTQSTSGPSPSFDLVELAGRVVVLMFDSNAQDHQGVRAAREGLAREMTNRKAAVKILDVPQTSGVNGPDDFIEVFGDNETMKLTRHAKAWALSLVALRDMPREVLDGKLGEICERHFSRFPVAYAWPALITAASAIVPRHSESQRINLYTALIGPVGTGKTQAIDNAQKILGVGEPTLMSVMAGSAELLAKYMKDAWGAPRLFSPDELSHVLEKASILNASFASVLNRAYYHSKFQVLVAGKNRADFDASLSILGGLVESRFEDLFSAATTSGLYDRFLFGMCPTDFKFDYLPFEGTIDAQFAEKVFVLPEVWSEKTRWQQEDKTLSPRVVEIALRTATVCAAFDGRRLLRPEDLSPALEMARYQTRIRKILKPNEGLSPEGIIAYKILAYLERAEGKYVSKRDLLNGINAYRHGPSTSDRAMKVLAANGEIEITEKTRPIMVRRLNMNGDGE